MKQPASRPMPPLEMRERTSHSFLTFLLLVGVAVMYLVMPMRPLIMPPRKPARKMKSISRPSTILIFGSGLNKRERREDKIEAPLAGNVSQFVF